MSERLFLLVEWWIIMIIIYMIIIIFIYIYSYFLYIKYWHFSLWAFLFNVKFLSFYIALSPHTRDNKNRVGLWAISYAMKFTELYHIHKNVLHFIILYWQWSTILFREHNNWDTTSWMAYFILSFTYMSFNISFTRCLENLEYTIRHSIFILESINILIIGAHIVREGKREREREILRINKYQNI